MKTKKSAVLLAITSLLLVVTAVFSTVTANADQGYTTTITLDDGHTIDVANITECDVLSEEDYIKQHLNTDLVQDTGKFELADMLLAKNLIADETMFNGEEETIDNLNYNHMDALIIMNDIPVLVYDLDDESPYYVAKANTLINDPNYRVPFADFAYTNVNGELINDAIYDYETGLAYIPKYYKEEDKNGFGFYNVQIELLQMTSTQNPTTTIDVMVNVDGMPGEYAKSGRATLKGLATDFGIKVALDDEAIKNTYAENIRVKINGVYDEEWYYFDSEGIVQIQLSPNTINSLEIEINKENAETYLARIEDTANFTGQETHINYNPNNMTVKTEAGTWTFEDDPVVGQSYILNAGNSSSGSRNSAFYDVYYASEQSGRYGVYIDRPNGGDTWNALSRRIIQGTNDFNLSNLNESGGMIQHVVVFNQTVEQNGVTIPAGTTIHLRCSHGGVPVDNTGWNMQYIDGANRPTAYSLLIRVLDVQEEYLVVGLATNELYTQNGAAICKIRYKSDGGGFIHLHKTDVDTGDAKNGDAVRVSATYGVWQGSEMITTVTTDNNGNAVTEKIKKGTYSIREISAPVGYNLSNDTFTVEITSDNKEPLVTVTEKVKENDLIIKKDIEATSNTEQKALDECQFTATLISDRSKVYTSERTAEGEYTIRNLPYGTYEVVETQTNKYSLTCDKFNVFIEKDRSERGAYGAADGQYETVKLAQNPNRTQWTDAQGHLVDIAKVMVINIHKVDYDKDENDPKTYMQGDAKLEGAVYEIYKFNEETQDYTDYVYDITVDHMDDGYWTATSGELLVGKYMVKEKVKSEEEIDGVTYQYSYAKGYLVDPEPHYFEQVPEEQTERVSQHYDISREKVQRGRVTITKYDDDRDTDPNQNDSDKVPSAGARLRLTLVSNPEIYYEVVLDDNGEGEFLETNDGDAHVSTAIHDSLAAYAPNTIPYGEYEITEIKEADDTERESFFAQPEPVSINKQCTHENRIISDVPVPVWLKLVKKDSTTNQIVKEAGATFSVWNVKEQRFEMQKVYPSAVEISEFETTDEGWLYLPQKLFAGDYVIYEVDAPEGYYLDDEYRLPEDPADYGVVGGKRVHIDKVLTGLPEDAVNPGHVEVGEFEYESIIKNTPLYINIKIIKTSDRLTGAQEGTVTYPTTPNEEVEVEMTTPVYTDGIGLGGVKYEIYADQDIISPDGQLRFTNNQLVDTIVTDQDGIGQSRDDLFPGRYRVVEVEVPEGYILDRTPKYITAENNDQYVQSATATLEITDVRQHLGYKFKKIFKQYKYATGGERKHAVFGIYTKDPINNYLGDRVIGPDTLVDILVVDGDSYVETTTDLPNGRYYVRELYVSYPYAMSQDTVDFTLAFNGDGVTPKVVVEGPEIENTPDYGYAKFIKLSKSINDNIIMNGSELDEEGLNEKSLEILDAIANMTNEEVAAYLIENGYQFVPGAQYEIWLDEEGTNKLQEVNLQTGDLKVVTFTTNESGILELFEIPKGAYFLKEVEAPEGYEVLDEVVPFTITSSNPETTLYQAIFDESVKTTFLHKTDIFTGENVPNCTFEITDESGKVILKATTDEDGLAWIPNDAFKPYKDVENPKFYYTELEAPDVYKEDGKLYKLNTEPHEFTGTFDEETGVFTTDLHEVENYRPTTNVKFVKTDEESNLVPNCKFELKSEEENLYYKTGVTDENGIYVFENVPQGWYTYTELEAPEQYDLDTTPHRVYVTGDEMIIDFVNTGDIPVVAIACLAVVCIAGVAFVTIRKFKLAKNN